MSVDYLYILRKAKELIGKKKLQFTEYDIANQVYIEVHDNKSISTLDLYKIIRRCYSEEIRSEFNHISFDERFKKEPKNLEKEAICIDCRELFPVSNFRIHVYKKSGYTFRSSYCFECARERSRKLWQKNRKRYNELSRKWSEKNRKKGQYKYIEIRRAYEARITLNLEDPYIRRMINYSNKLKGIKVEITQHVIIAKRKEILLKREKLNNNAKKRRNR